MSSTRALSLAILLMTIFPDRGAAQTVDVKAGITFATLHDPESAGQASQRMGLVGGIAVRVPRARRASLQIESLLVEKGGRFPWGDNRFRYAEAPILGRVELGPPDASRRAYVIGGVAPALKISARNVGHDPPTDISRLKAVDVGLVAGAGLQFGGMLIEARYTHGLTTIHQDDGHDHGSTRHRVFAVLAGYRMR